MAKHPPNQHDLEVEVDGVRYTGWYSVESGAVSVRYRWWTKATQVGGSTPEHIARMLLFELVIEHRDEPK